MTNILPVHFDSSIRQSEANAQTKVRTLHAALGAFVLLVEQHLPPEQHDLFHAHAVDIDAAVNALFGDHQHLLAALAGIQAYISVVQQQRDDAIYALKDAMDRADEAESTAEANIYQRLLDNLQETFYCSRETADKLLFALWDAHADVDDNTSVLLDEIANAIDSTEVR